jgi:hypothetical protein
VSLLSESRGDTLLIVRDDHRDVIDTVPSLERQRRLGRARFRLRHLLFGTFCFPYGKAFHCGGTETLSIAAGQEVSASIGWNSVSIGAKATVQTTETLAFTAPLCVFCRPQICFFESHLWVWQSERDVGQYRMNGLYSDFRPSSLQQLFDQNGSVCPECMAQPPPAWVPTETRPMTMSSGTSRTVSIMRVDDRPRGASPDSPLDAAVEFVSSFAAPLGADDTVRPELVAVRQIDGSLVTLLAAEAGPLQVALLSTDVLDEVSGGRNVRPGDVLPVLVASRRTGEPWGAVKLLRHSTSPGNDDGSLETVYEASLEVSVDDFFTVGWGAVELHEKVWPPGSVGELRVEVGDGATDERAETVLPLWSEVKESR